MKLTISIAQFDLAFGDPAQNLARVTGFAAEAARRGSELLLLPELWSTGYDLENAGRHATTTDSGVFKAIATLAGKHKIDIVGSQLAILGSERYGNTLTWHNANGERIGEYSKLHLFGLMQEDQFLAPGPRAQLVKTPWGVVGLAICYDLRFPELFRHYALQQATMVVLPSEWPHPRLYHWRTLLRARAIENQMYIIACNRVGTAKGDHFCGHSAIIDPWGEVVVEGGEEELLLTATIETDTVAQVRAKIPIFADRRPEQYQL